MTGAGPQTHWYAAGGFSPRSRNSAAMSCGAWGARRASRSSPEACWALAGQECGIQMVGCSARNGRQAMWALLGVFSLAAAVSADAMSADGSADHSRICG